DGPSRLEQWRTRPHRDTWRRLQPYVVNLYLWEARRFEEEGWIERISQGLCCWRGPYDLQRGLRRAHYDPSDLIC
ncbi:MAG: CRISPR-associated helicase/endonuclease Cas3, partial [Bacillota bacterium]